MLTWNSVQNFCCPRNCIAVKVTKKNVSVKVKGQGWFLILYLWPTLTAIVARSTEFTPHDPLVWLASLVNFGPKLTQLAVFGRNITLDKLDIYYNWLANFDCMWLTACTFVGNLRLRSFTIMVNNNMWPDLQKEVLYAQIQIFRNTALKYLITIISIMHGASCTQFSMNL